MEKKNRRFPQPSICAASNKSFGKLESKNVLATIMLYTITEKGKTITQNVSYK